LFVERKDWDNAREHAKASSDPVLIKLIAWEYALDPDSGASFADITRFIKENPYWPDQKKLRQRAETSLKDDSVSDHDIIAWFGDDTPVTGIGKIALAKALARSKNADNDKIESLIHEGWRGGDFDESQEKQLLETYGHLLTSKDHIARIDRLLWEGRATAAKHLLSHVPGAEQRLFKARIELIDDKKTAKFSVAQVPSALKNDPGLIYDRMSYRGRRDDDSGVREMLLAAPATVPYPEKWWKHREYQIRTAIDEKNYKMAKKLLANHGQLEGSELADAMWLEGWLKTEFLDQSKDGYKDFYAMFDKVKYPVSKARAAYWAARAAEKSADSEAADNWYKTAASYPTTFYGQLACLKQSGEAPLRIPSPPPVSSEAKQRFENNDVIDAIKLSAELDQSEVAKHMVAWMVENSNDDGEIALMGTIGERSGYVHLGVRAAKRALQQNVVLLDAGYPTTKTPENAPIERALTLAITRQESEFDPEARSPSNAIGMMQLLPATAKEIARKNDMGFSRDRLQEPLYNMTIGSMYLGHLINNYDGSYVMAIAAYNAGSGNVHNWAEQFGTPNNNLDNAVNWIEKIPFTETRNYVQRVLENLQIYRNIEADGNSKPLKLDDDLIR